MWVNLMSTDNYKLSEAGLIPKEWDTKKLKELLYIKGRIGWKGLQKSEFGSDGALIINGPEINDGKVDWNKCLRVPKWRYDESPEIAVKENDILMTKDGTIGKVAFLDHLAESATLASGIFLIRIEDPTMLDQKFFFQYLKSQIFKELVRSRTEGSVIPHLYQRDIEELYVPLPPIIEQRLIGHLLSNLDQKIELNQQMNKTLESIAQALFKHWFIDFEFPDENGNPYKSSGGEMVDSELGEIPKGWFIRKLDGIANFLNGLALQKYPAVSEEEYLPVIKIREMNSGISESSDKASFNIPQEYVVDNGDILFAWSGSLGVTIWCNGKGALNQHLFKVSSKEYPKWFYYQWLMHYLPDFIEIARDKATTMGHIQRHHLSKSTVVVPDSSTLETMNKIFNPIVGRIINLKVENDTLTKARDLLLPKLISGKIRVPLEGTNV